MMGKENVMRFAICALAVLAAGCSVDVNGAHHGGYAVEVRANGEDHVYIVTAPDGRVASAQSVDGHSAMLDAAHLQRALAAMPVPTTPDDGRDNVSIRAPGFSMHASGDDDDDDTTTSTTTAAASHAPPPPAPPAAANAQKKPAEGSDDEHDGHGGHGNVSINFGGFGMQVNADDGGPGHADDRAQVRLTGLSAHDARKFITDADDLSPAVQAQMLTALGMSQNEERAAGNKDDDNN
jgi:hypothetical protein